MADGKVTIDSELNDKGLEKGLTNLQSKLHSTGSKMQSVGKTMTKAVSLPLAAIAGFAIKTGMDFEEGMSTVRAVTGATESEMADLTAQARELGSTTKFSALEASEGMEYLGRAGFDATEIAAALPGVLDLAAASATDLGVAADITTGILSGFGLGAGEAGRVADILAYSSANSKTDVEGMGEAMKYVAPIAAQMGISVEDTSAAIALLSDNSIEGGQAGNMLKRGLLNMASGSGPAADEMERLGMEMFDAEDNMKSLPEIMEELEKGTEGMTSKQKLNTLETIFGAQAVAGWAALLDEGSDTLGDFSQELENSTGFAAEMAAIMTDNTKGALIELKSAIDEVAIQIFTALQPALDAAIGLLTDLAAWFNGLSDEVVAAIVTVGAIVAAIGPLLTIIGTIIIVISKVIGAFAMLTPPIMIAIGIITALIAIGVALAANWETIKAKATEVFSKFEPMLDPMKQAFENLKSSVNPIIENLKTLWESLLPIIQKVGIVVGSVLAVSFGIAISVISAVVSAIGPLINAFISLADFVVNTVNFIIAVLTGDFAGAMEYWNAMTEATIGVFKGLWDGLVNFFTTFIDTIVGFFHGLYMTLVGNSIIPDMVEAIIEWFQNMFDWLIEIVMNIVEGITEAFMNVYETITGYFEMIGEIIASVWEYITETFSNALDFILALVTGDFEGMKDAIQSQMENAQNLLENIWDAIDTFLSNTLGGIWDTVKSIFSNIFSTISSILGNVSSTISSIWNSISSTISSVLSSISSTISSIWNSISSTISSVLSSISSTISSIWNSISSTISSVLSSISSTISSIWNSISSTISSVLSSISSTISSIWNSISSTISSVLSSISSTISSIWNGIRSTISSVVNGIRSTISSIFNSLRGIVTGAMSNVRSAVSDGIRGALDVITNLGSSFKEAGSKIVSMIADGIKGAASKVTGAAKDLMGKVRDYLPFSPAKVGPLTDIHRLNFDGPIGDSIENAIPDVQAKMNAMLQVPTMQPAANNHPKPVARDQTDSDGQTREDKQPAIINVHVGSKKVASEIVDDITNLQNRKSNRKRNTPKLGGAH